MRPTEGHSGHPGGDDVVRKDEFIWNADPVSSPLDRETRIAEASGTGEMQTFAVHPGHARRIDVACVYKFIRFFSRVVTFVFGETPDASKYIFAWMREIEVHSGMVYATA